MDAMVGGEWQEAEQVVQVAIWLPRGLARNLESLAVETRGNRSAVVEDLLLKELLSRVFEGDWVAE